MIWHGGALPDIARLNAQAQGCAIPHLGIELVEAGPDWLAARMPVDARTRQPFGMLHGGASVLLIETVASMAALAVIDPAAAHVAGLEVNANHLRPVAAGHVTATARAEALGRTTQVWTVRVTDDAGRLACLGRITMAVLPRRS